ncbi:DUF202 domain-containing protein [Paenibacillus spiritus]|uniref:DUF202 domain-containing protein n=1 Tax=Paenibacillus spiritus TaxID=2496557 RepID=A0A5J5G9J8_9BACL|nr:DUF202 domain-containing protein [Paenibacillus spiritus]KAA9004204.1 DUF202 domain-containing protein [Paenibacillus spiritus]
MNQPLHEERYTQQHLANERTYLAWVRTSIAVIGLGFLSAGIAFRTEALASVGHWIASIGGVGAVLLGALIQLLATLDFQRRRREINAGVFHSRSIPVWSLFIAMTVICSLLIILVVMMFYDA